MSDFSNKYKSAVEEIKISPDFKERTAKKMIELRDSESTEKHSKIKLYRGLSAVAAAAACIAVAFSLNQAGYFDSSSEPAAIVTDTIENPAQTAAELPAEASENTNESVGDLPEKAFAAEEESIAVPDFTSAEAEYEEIIPETAAQTEAAVTSASGKTGDNDAGITEQAAEPKKSDIAKATESAVTEAALAEEYITEAIGQTDENKSAEDEALPLGIAEYAPPSGEAASEISGEGLEGDYDESTENIESGEGADDSTIFDDSLNSEAVLVSESTAEDFSSKDAISGFKASSSYAVIMPAVSGYSEDGSVVSYSEKKVKSVKELQSLEKELYTYTEDKIASAAAEAPADSSYIVDFADYQGNSLRIYIGSRYIIFSLSDGNLYSYDISGDEYAAIDSFIMSLVA